MPQSIDDILENTNRWLNQLNQDPNVAEINTFKYIEMNAPLKEHDVTVARFKDGSFQIAGLVYSDYNNGNHPFCIVPSNIIGQGNLLIDYSVNNLFFAEININNFGRKKISESYPLLLELLKTPEGYGTAMKKVEDAKRLLKMMSPTEITFWTLLAAPTSGNDPEDNGRTKAVCLEDSFNVPKKYGEETKTLNPEEFLKYKGMLGVREANGIKYHALELP